MERAIITFLTLFFVTLTFSTVIPDEKCSLKDKSCLIRNAQKLLLALIDEAPEYDIEDLDPLVMDNVAFNSSGLLFSLSDATLKGIKEIIFDDFIWDFDKKVLRFTFHTDVTLKGHYTAKGQILTVPISGDGDIKIKLKNMEFKVALYFDIVKKDNKDYAKITKYEYNYEVKDNANYQLTNLFAGNKELSDAVLKFANENWKQLASLFGKPLIDVVADKAVKSLNKILKQQALDTFLIYDTI